ncbi:MAG: hypothetical protein AB1603_06265 [Chloroflexota bacterium]
MGLRAYLVIKVKKGIGREEFVEVVKGLETMPEVDFVDPVKGLGNLVVMVDCPVTVEAVAEKIKARPWVESLDILSIVDVFERHAPAGKKALAGC